MPGILDLMNNIEAAGDRGRERGQQSRLGMLYSGALQAPQEQRGGFLAEMAKVSPQAAYDAQTHFGSMDDNARQQLGRYAQAFDALPDEQKAQAYPQLAQKAQQLGIPAPMEWRPEFAPNIQRLAQAFGGGQAQASAPHVVGNALVGPDGKVLYQGEAASKAPSMFDIPDGHGGTVKMQWDDKAGGLVPLQFGGEVPYSVDPSLPPEVQAQIRNDPRAGSAEGISTLGYKPPAARAPSALQEKIATARSMGASDDQIRAMVLGGQGNGDSATAPQIGDQTKTGADFLQSLAPEQAKMVRALADGRMQFPTGTALKSPYWQQLVSAVQQYDPSAEGGSYATRLATRKAFTSGKQAGQINALNTTAGHLKVLADAAKALHNSSVPAYNTVANFLSKEAGNPAVTNFQSAIPAVASEMERIYRENGGSEEGIRAWKDSLKPNSSPEQIAGVLRTWVGLIKSKLDAMNDQYTQGMGTMATPLHMVNKHAQDAYDALTKIEKQLGQSQPANPAHAGFKVLD